MSTQDTDDDRVLAAWSRRLVDALQIMQLDVDQRAILGLAGRAAHAVLRPAAPLTTFIVGYAAGLAAAGGKRPEEAVRDAIEVALQLCRIDPEEDPSADGWTSTAQ